jgi:hypothetical protein
LFLNLISIQRNSMLSICKSLPGYKFPPFRRDRQHKTGGGGIVYVKEHINCIVRPDIELTVILSYY